MMRFPRLSMIVKQVLIVLCIQHAIKVKKDYFLHTPYFIGSWQNSLRLHF